MPADECGRPGPQGEAGKGIKMKLKFVAALLAGSALTISAPAFAAQTAGPAEVQPEPTEPDQSDAAADHHWPFTRQRNASGRISGIRAAEASAARALV